MGHISIFYHCFFQSVIIQHCHLLICHLSLPLHHPTTTTTPYSSPSMTSLLLFLFLCLKTTRSSSTTTLTRTQLPPTIIIFDIFNHHQITPTHHRSRELNTTTTTSTNNNAIHKVNVTTQCGVSTSLPSNIHATCQVFTARCECTQCVTNHHTSRCTECPTDALSIFVLEIAAVLLGFYLFFCLLYVTFRSNHASHSSVKNVGRHTKQADNSSMGPVLLNVVLNQMQILGIIISKIQWSAELPRWLVDVLLSITSLFSINISAMFSLLDCNFNVQPLDKWLASVLMLWFVALAFLLWYLLARCHFQKTQVHDDSVVSTIIESTVNVLFIGMYTTVVRTCFAVFDCDFDHTLIMDPRMLCQGTSFYSFMCVEDRRTYNVHHRYSLVTRTELSAATKYVYIFPNFLHQLFVSHRTATFPFLFSCSLLLFSSSVLFSSSHHYTSSYILPPLPRSSQMPSCTKSLVPLSSFCGLSYPSSFSAHSSAVTVVKEIENCSNSSMTCPTFVCYSVGLLVDTERQLNRTIQHHVVA